MSRSKTMRRAAAGNVPSGGGGVGPSGVAMPNADLPGWDLVFNDDFLIDLPEGGWSGCDHGLQRCLGLPPEYEDRWFNFADGTMDTSDLGTYSPSQVNSVSNHMLRLRMRHEGGVIKVTAPVPIIPGQLSAGEANSQLHGRFAIRWLADPTPGYKVAWLWWPDDGNSLLNGEIDFPEADLDGTISAFVHRTGATDPSGADQDIYGTSVDFAGAWHTAVTEWTAGDLKFYLDGALIGHMTARVPAQPMHLVLQSETALGSVTPAPGSVANIYIDWVAMWHEA